MKRTLVVLLIISMGFLLTAGINFFFNNRVDEAIRVITGSLLVLDFIVYGVLIITRNNSNKLIQMFWIAVVLCNLLLTLFDEVGVADFAFLAVNILILIIYVFNLWKGNGKQSVS